MKTIVTHISPDVDAISSIWLVQRFYRGWGNAMIKFVPAGSTLNHQPPDENLEIIHVDTGLGKFDHHQSNENTCAAEKVFLFLKKRGDIKNNFIQPLEKMVTVINDIDHFRDVFLPNSDDDIYAFLLDSILEGIRIKFQDDEQLVSQGKLIFDGILQTFINRVQAEKEIERGLIIKTKWGKTIAIESENEETSRLAQKKGFAMVIRKSPKKGYLRIKALPLPRLNLKKLYQVLKKNDPRAYWYFHSSGHMILNGSSKNPNTTPTKLTLPEVVKIIKEIK